ncbi:hypothetical protein [Ensifer sp. PDNC004]|uniref:hypothetical protein n=1 Tax=Ensifer sp. PDNC004 TaxID=2811423 RepID=UPI001FEFC4A3|nr:hypothetical protein [Ensifer sp. PDNC004]
MFSYSESEVVGQPIYLIITDDKRDKEADIRYQCAGDRRSRHICQPDCRGRDGGACG